MNDKSLRNQEPQEWEIFHDWIAGLPYEALIGAMDGIRERVSELEKELKEDGQL